MKQASYEVREPVLQDIGALEPIMECWVRDRRTGEPLPAEVADIKSAIRDSIKGDNEQKYVVAEESGKLLGIMGIQTPDSRMQEYTQTSDPVELITALVSDEVRGKGVGKALVRALAQRAQEEGATELVVNSGLRYELSGWPFWQSQFGEPAGIAPDYYGPGSYAMVWRKALDETK
jgi:GNAT superfamily N-acetyltransferase